MRQLLTICVLLIALAIGHALSVRTSSAQFVDRIVRPCSTGIVPLASVIVNPANSGNINVTPCTGGSLTVNGVPVATGTIGPGSVNRVAKFTAATTIGNSTITDDASTVTTTVPYVTTTGLSSFQAPQGVIGASAPWLSHSATWSNVGITFVDHLVNITDTASAAASLLMDLRVGGISQFSVSKAGVITVNSCVGCVGVANFANPTALVGLAAVNGVATTAMRSDAAPAIDQAIAPTWTGIHTFTNQIISTQGTLAGASTPFLSHTATWNNAATTFINFNSNVTNTASNVLSKLINLQVGGANRFAVTVNGRAALGPTAASNTIYLNITDTTLASSFQGIAISLTNTPVADSSIAGINSGVTTTGTVIQTGQTIGVGVSSVFSSTGGNSATYGVVGFQGTTVISGSAGTVVGAASFRALMLHTSSGSTTSRYGFVASLPTGATATTNIVNNYGFYSEAQNTVGTTNAFNFYSAGASSRNRFEGTVRLATLQFDPAGVASLADSSTAPTVSGFGAAPAPSVTANNGTVAFTINVGGGGVATTGTITLPTATTGWACDVTDLTNNALYVTSQTGGTTTTATVQNYSRTTGLVIAWTASDILSCSCRGY